MYLSPLYPSLLRSIISNTNYLNGWVAGNSYYYLREICYICFDIKQVLYLILSGAYSLANLVSFTPLIYLGSCLIVSGSVWLSILYYFKAVTSTSL